jgi:predicted Mrr-cat superfamily restriction endonuclease
MNYSTAVFLINDNCRALEVIYEPDSDDGKFKAPREIVKTFDKSIKKGDLLIVPSSTRHHVTTVKVTAVDVEFDPNWSDIKWVIGVIDMSLFEEMKATEEAAISMIKAAEKTDARNKLREKMFAHVDAEKLKTLALANLSDV